MPQDQTPPSDPVLRQATCHCGQLSLEASGEPVYASVCSCADCQRRTGSAFGLSAWLAEADVRTAGRATTFARVSDARRWLQFHFCPECGTTLWWRADFRAGFVAVAGGCFADPSFPVPERSVWDRSRHVCIERLGDIPSQDGQPG